MLHSEIVSLRSNRSALVMSWKSGEKEKSSPVVVAVGISFLHSAMFVMLIAGSGGESKKESLNEGVSTKTQERKPFKTR